MKPRVKAGSLLVPACPGDEAATLLAGAEFQARAFESVFHSM